MMEMLIKTRLAAEHDAEQLAKLNQKFNGGSRRETREIIESIRTSNELIAVAEIEGKLVGFACAQSFKSFCYPELQGEITEMFVETFARRKGVATSLIACLEESLKSRGVTEIKVLTGSQNDAAIQTYMHCNYEKDDELLLKKQLPDYPTN